ncbi:Mu-like prophage I protein [Hartmannibacter diazotrophicus]|uniref:Mu-like prophage I protein n=1 Tax=Hartmannibacter diazotrophicus TaxID=1482074 RepID=A0A2C9D6L0_9HYPH|nr:phage protease [Hartmannibacter diazotrophicus]SON55809.1 Mu-like prophage I protein [Hartmannibacter diazotrophicus]
MTATPHFSLLDASPVAAFGVVTLAFDAATGEAPQWVQIAPAGRVTTRDNRSFEFDAAVLAARFAADKVQIPVDLDHASLAGAGADPRTVGWVVEMQARPEGLFGRVDWLDEGLATLKARTRRYISPGLRHDETGRATWIHSIALVAAPALSMPALASAQPSEPSMSVTAFAAALGLAANTDETAVLSALTTRFADNTKKIDELTSSLTAEKTRADDAETKLAALKTATRQTSVDAVLEDALKDKRMLPAEKESFAKLSATDEGFEQVKAILAARPKALGASGLDERDPPETETGSTREQAAALAARINKRIAENATHGITIDAATALSQIEAEDARKR